VGGDLAVEDRLGERGFVGLVVAVAAEAHHVDHDIPAELHAELEGEQRDHADGLGIVAVHVKDRRLNHLGHVRAVVRGTRVARQRGEADLVIDHDVQRATGRVAGELREVERLRDHALAREGGVAVHEQREHASPLGVTADPLAGAGLALDDRVDDFQVRRVGGEPDLDLRAGSGVEDRLVSEMVLHITVPGDRLGDVVLGELFEQDLKRLAQDRRQDVESAAVGHAHDDFLDPDSGRALDDRVERGNERLSTLERESLLTHVLGVQKALEQLGLVQAAQDTRLLVLGEGGLVPVRLHPILQPASHLGVLNVSVLDADASAVGLAQAGDQFPQGDATPVQVVPGIEGAIEVRLAQPELLQGEARRRLGRSGERIEVRVDVTDRTVMVDQAVDLGLLERVIGRGEPRCGPGGCGAGLACGGWSGAGREGEPMEKGVPRGIDGLRILQPGSIGRVDDVGIGPGGQGEGVHGREGGLTGPVSSVLTGDCRKPLKHGLR
jgi:hypothetical protein